ncbi:unnamed protein product, partial [Amoebophrya sp. A120]
PHAAPSKAKGGRNVTETVVRNPTVATGAEAVPAARQHSHAICTDRFETQLRNTLRGLATEDVDRQDVGPIMKEYDGIVEDGELRYLEVLGLIAKAPESEKKTQKLVSDSASTQKSTKHRHRRAEQHQAYQSDEHPDNTPRTVLGLPSQRIQNATTARTEFWAAFARTRANTPVERAALSVFEPVSLLQFGAFNLPRLQEIFSVLDRTPTRLFVEVLRHVMFRLDPGSLIDSFRNILRAVDTRPVNDFFAATTDGASSFLPRLVTEQRAEFVEALKEAHPLEILLQRV